MTLTSPSATRAALIGAVAFVCLVPGTDGHLYQLFPTSRQVYNSPVFKDNTFDKIEYQPSFYNARGPDEIRKRAKANTDPGILAEYGGGEWPLKVAYDKGEVHPNGNYYQREELAVRHGICGDPKQVGPENVNVYSTPNSEWPVLETFQSGSVLEIKAVMRFYHWGHLEFFLCNAADMDDPNGTVTQTCLNKYPLTRATGDDANSPVDPSFPGRYYNDPECRENEVDQTKPSGAEEGQVMHMKYQLPDIACERCILQLVYYTANSCKHVGYDDFNPPSWPAKCAPNKDQWVELNRKHCGDDGTYPEEFWACSDISLTGGGGGGTPSTGGDGSGDDPIDEPTKGSYDPAAQPTTEPSDSASQPTADPSDSEYLDCFADKWEDRVMDDMMKSDSMTPTVCREHCVGKGGRYYGLQYGLECWCGSSDSLSDYDRHGPGNCNMPCTGDASITCGGFNAFGLFKIQ